MRAERRAGLLLLLPALLVLAAFLLVPIAWAFGTSLTVDNPFEPRRFVGLANYARFLGDREALGSVEFTLLFVAVSVALEILLGLGIALAVHPAFRGRGLARAAVLVPWSVPPVVSALMWRYMFNDQYGFVNLLLHGARLQDYRAWLADPWSARAAIVLADVWKTSSFAAILILAGLQAVPDDLLEAARVDGAGAVRRFFRVTLPLLRPALLLAVLFRTADAFRVFDLVFVMTQGAPAGATNVLSFFGYEKMFPEQQFGYGAAVSVVVFLMVAVVAAATVRVMGARVLER